MWARECECGGIPWASLLLIPILLTEPVGSIGLGMEIKECKTTSLKEMHQRTEYNLYISGKLYADIKIIQVLKLL